MILLINVIFLYKHISSADQVYIFILYALKISFFALMLDSYLSWVQQFLYWIAIIYHIYIQNPSIYIYLYILIHISLRDNIEVGYLKDDFFFS